MLTVLLLILGFRGVIWAVRVARTPGDRVVLNPFESGFMIMLILGGVVGLVRLAF